MKLYFSPGACSLAPHIALRETGLAFDLDKVDLSTRQTETGEDFTRINPKGYVPALKLDNGEILTEVAVLLQYIADQKPESNLVPKFGGMERYHLMEWLNFISSEIHKTLGVMFNPAMTPEWRENQLVIFGKRSDFLTTRLAGNPFLTGETFSIADAYLFTVLGWTSLHKIDMSKWPALTDYMHRIAGRHSVTQAMKAEGLI